MRAANLRHKASPGSLRALACAPPTGSVLFRRHTLLSEDPPARLIFRHTRPVKDDSFLPKPLEVLGVLLVHLMPTTSCQEDTSFGIGTGRRSPVARSNDQLELAILRDREGFGMLNSTLTFSDPRSVSVVGGVYTAARCDPETTRTRTPPRTSCCKL